MHYSYQVKCSSRQINERQMTKALENMYKKKITSANNAIEHINQGANIYVGAFCSEPQKLVAELVKLSLF